ncbi:tumor necrosis factor receptor superfamily member 4-like isoform X2 [Seriola dumerili]|uniref:tumor necrosis factor receptor superfamily member 4-like isoform X2 n=1 Tax=Seriola dumerili TaxID=41447 RepID=UPI000BBEA65A|nr:tumor necrosis factor receptor superfamily member 4-like isoform X2 [Seriola dumerili]
MVLLKFLILTLTFYELFVNLEAGTCPKGHSLSRKADCKICPDGYYQPEENDSLSCRPCTMCEEHRGSAIEQKCTKETDTKCQCREGFVPWGSDSSTCKCDIGFGLTNGKCSKCEVGFFSKSINSPCQKWKECKSGEKIPGTSSSDVICIELKSNPDITTPDITFLPSHSPHEETQAQNLHTTTTTTTSTTTTTALPGHTLSTKKNRDMQPPPSNTGSHIGLAVLMFGIVGLLVLTAVTCKLHITPCVQRKPAVQTKDSLCRRPIEEIGDGSQSSLKQNPEP